MLNLATCSDPKILRQVASLQEQEIKRLHERTRALERKLATLQGTTPEELQLRLMTVELQLAQRNKALFGDKSEQRSKPETTSDTPKPKAQTGHGRREQNQLKLIEQIHLLDQADKDCPKCGGELLPWKDQFESSEEITEVQRRFVLVRHRRQKYRCQCGCIDTALGPTKLIPNGRYSIDFAVGAAVSKYLDHSPLERQVAIMAREGLTIDSQTLWDQLWALSQPLIPTYEAIQRHVLQAKVVFADETTWRLMSGGDSKRCYDWGIACADAVFHKILDSRSQHAALEMLNGYTGTVMADGYKAYDAISARAGPFRVAHCWSHVRRKFIDIESAFAGECKTVLDLIGQLYAVETELPSLFDLTTNDDALIAAKRLQLRQERSKVIIGKIRDWAFAAAQRCLPNSGLRGAIDYMLGIWPGLTMFLNNSALPLDNNHAERSLRSVVLGRKNHYGSRSTRGLEVAALFYTVLGTAKLAGVEPHAYLAKAALAAIQTPGTVTLPWA